MDLVRSSVPGVVSGGTRSTGWWLHDDYRVCMQPIFELQKLRPSLDAPKRENSSNIQATKLDIVACVGLSEPDWTRSPSPTRDTEFAQVVAGQREQQPSKLCCCSWLACANQPPTPPATPRLRPRRFRDAKYATRTLPPTPPDARTHHLPSTHPRRKRKIGTNQSKPCPERCQALSKTWSLVNRCCRFSRDQPTALVGAAMQCRRM